MSGRRFHRASSPKRKLGTVCARSALMEPLGTGWVKVDGRTGRDGTRYGQVGLKGAGWGLRAPTEPTSTFPTI